MCDSVIWKREYLRYLQNAWNIPASRHVAGFNLQGTFVAWCKHLSSHFDPRQAQLRGSRVHTWTCRSPVVQPRDGRSHPHQKGRIFFLQEVLLKGVTNHLENIWIISYPSIFSISSLFIISTISTKRKWLPEHFCKLTWQWNMDLLKMYSLLKSVTFHCHVSLPERYLTIISSTSKALLSLVALVCIRSTRQNTFNLGTFSGWNNFNIQNGWGSHLQQNMYICGDIR